MCSETRADQAPARAFSCRAPGSGDFDVEVAEGDLEGVAVVDDLGCGQRSPHKDVDVGAPVAIAEVVDDGDVGDGAPIGGGLVEGDVGDVRAESAAGCGEGEDLAGVGSAADLGGGVVGLQAGDGGEQGEVEVGGRREGLVSEHLVDDLVFVVV